MGWVGTNSKHAYLQLIFGREKKITHPTRRDNQPVELASWSLCCYCYCHCVVVISIVIIIVWPNIFILPNGTHLYYYITNVSLNQNQCKGTSRVVAWFGNGRYDLNLVESTIIVCLLPVRQAVSTSRPRNASFGKICALLGQNIISSFILIVKPLTW